MKKTKLNLIIKIGTAALGAADGMPDSERLGRLISEIVNLKKDGHNIILVSSGAVGTGRALTKKGKQPILHCEPVVERQILASLGQAKLMSFYQDLLTPHNILASQVLLTKQDFRTRGHTKHMLALFAALQKQPNILPIVNENDSVTIDELMFTDNDELAGLLAAIINADRLIILSHIEGVYDRPPDEEGAQVIPLIDWKKNKGVPESTKGKSQTGRGGMSSKLSMARKMADLGIYTHIAAAGEPNIIARILNNENVGTTIHPLPGKRNAVKRWIASEVNQIPASVTANKCLADMILKPGQAISLLPIGLTKISGNFSKGDLVKIVDEKGKTLALGVARYDATLLRQSLGKKQQPVFIHYDQLHLVQHD